MDSKKIINIVIGIVAALVLFFLLDKLHLFTGNTLLVIIGLLITTTAIIIYKIWQNK